MTSEETSYSSCTEECERLQAQSDIYGFMASLFRLPTESVVEGMANGMLKRELEDVVVRLDLTVDADGMKEAYDQLDALATAGGLTLTSVRHAHTTLFTHPEKPLLSLYESIFLYFEKNPDGSFEEAPRLFVSPAAASAGHIYKKAGLSCSGEVNEPADHIATELEFLARLLAEKAHLLSERRACEAEALDEVLSEFVSWHLEKWGIAFFDRLAALDVHPLYCLIGRVGSGIMMQTIETVQHSKS